MKKFWNTNYPYQFVNKFKKWKGDKMNTDQIIQEYKDAYRTVHSIFPKVEKRGSWIYINDLTPIRAKQIPEMTINLEKIANKKEVKKEVKKEDYSDLDLLMEIKKEAKFIFGSTNVKGMQLSAKKIIKLISTLMNKEE